MVKRGLLILVFISCAAGLSAQTTDEKAGNHFQLARAAEKSGDYQKAESEYKEVLKLKPEVPEVYANLGLVEYLLGRDEDAIATFRQALKRNPDLMAASLFLGMAYLRINQYAKSVEPLERAIALNPKELKAYTNLGVSYSELGREEQAAKVLEKANELFPNNIEVLYNLGRTYTKLMEKSYKSMAQVDPDSYRFHEVLGDTYRVRKDYPNATAEYLKALEKSPSPNTPGLHYSLGTAYWMEAKWEPAIEEFKKELAISPENYLATWKLGDIYLSQRKYDESLVYLKKALKQRPDLAQAYRDLGRLCIQTGKPEEAIVYLKKVAELAPEEPSEHYLMAQAYRKLGKEPELKAELELFQKLKKAENEKIKHPDPTVGVVSDPNEKPPEDLPSEELQ